MKSKVSNTTKGEQGEWVCHKRVSISANNGRIHILEVEI